MPDLTLGRRDYDAAIFDLDGVLTKTARVHEAAWKEMFDDFLAARGEREGREVSPFEEEDYRRYVDGKPRYDGVQSFLEARGISLPRGEPDDPPARETVCGLGNRKNELFLERLKKDGVTVFPDAEPLLDALEAAEFRLAVVSSSRNCRAVLEAAGLAGRFEARVDGVEAERLGLEGKPAPDLFLEAAQRVGAAPNRAVVWEDARAGVEAGRRGHFGLVVGVARQNGAEELLESGADVVVRDFASVRVDPERPGPMGDLPSALGQAAAIVGEADEIAAFLDYDGTLTPIVEDPAAAVLDDRTREVVRRLAGLCTVAVVSGRDLPDVRRLVGLDDLIYAGSHGFDLHGPGDRRLENSVGDPFLPALDEAEGRVRDELEGVAGVRVERKKYAIAVHFRGADPGREPEVEEAVDRVLGEQPKLRKGTGKKIFELRPDVDWDKGRAVGWLLERLGLDRPGVVPLYLGDDVTDEDAFRALRGRGVGIVVRDGPRSTWARYGLEDPGEVRRFLEELASHREREAR
ncbi:MAG: trehalose-phosphatase [Deferrisomatales bacterium]|nr:trehalose-phosphatase [Deferrisomatales bacterium]